MADVSPLRLYAMRAMYLVMAIGLGTVIWPGIVSHRLSLPLANGVMMALLGAIGLGALLGLRYPLRMLPILLFELAWKVIWLAAFALPLWRAGQLDQATLQSVRECALGAVLILVIPWRHVFDHYVRAAGESWRIRPRMAAGPE